MNRQEVKQLLYVKISKAKCNLRMCNVQMGSYMKNRGSGSTGVVGLGRIGDRH